MRLYQQIPLLFPNYVWSDDARQSLLHQWCFEHRGVPDFIGYPPQQRLDVLNAIYEIHNYTWRYNISWLHDPLAAQYASRLFGQLRNWLWDPIYPRIYLTTQNLDSLNPPPILSAYFNSPMEWFMRTTLLPFLTYIAAKRQYTNLLTRDIPCVYLTVHPPGNGRARQFRILPQTLAALWKGSELMSETDQGDAVASELTSGIERMLVAFQDVVQRVDIALATYTPSIQSITRRQVGIFPLLHLVPGLDLSRYQIFSTLQVRDPPPHAAKHCLLWALECAGVPQETITSIAGFIPGRLVRLHALQKIFENAPFNLHVEYAVASDPTRVRYVSYSSDPTLPDVNLGLVDNHVFINEPIPVTPLYLTHAQTLPQGYVGQTNLASINHGFPDAYYDAPQYTSFQIINHLFFSQKPLLRRMNYYETVDSYRKLIDIDEFDENHLPYNPLLSSRDFAGNPDEKEPPEIWFADFEAFVDGEKHRPYLLCYGQLGKHIQAVDCVSSLPNAVHEMLDTIGEGILYFHNLAYDGSFLMNILRPQHDSIVEYGSNKLLAFKVRSRAGTVEIRDSLAVLPFPLRDFSKMLGIATEKEIMNYKAYNETTYRGQMTLHQLADVYSEQQIEDAAIRAGALRAHNHVDMWEYAVYYCKRDVQVLAEGYFRMNEMMQAATQQSLWHRLTAPSLAFHSLRIQGVFEGCKELTGAPAFCIRKTAIGGRCMLARNTKQCITGPIADFDAVSLYPSAMSLLYTLKGLPKVITEDDLLHWNERHPTWDGFFVEIDILAVHRKLDFPLISYKENGKRTFCNRTGIMWVNDITLQDLIAFHKIEYLPIRGYYYDEGKNYTLQTVIRSIFDLRLEAKRNKQPIEVVYKLLMNSCYGKTIMKPRHDKKNVVDETDLLKALGSSPFATVSYEPLQNDHFLIKTLVDVLQNWSFPTLGSHVLAMSKRLVTQVTSLAQDLGIGIYYTDTDSIHIDRDRIDDLAAAYRLKYDRELIGKDMCQFHTDFPVTQHGMMWSEKFIGVGKKAYIDCLTDGITHQYHIRLKGIPEQSILKWCERRNWTPDQLYQQFYENPEFVAVFDICDAKPAFSRKSNYLIASLEHFLRHISFPTSLEPFE